MKKLLLIGFSAFVLTGFSQEEKTWRLGVQIGHQANRSQFSGGTSDANARFHHNPYQAGSLNFAARYDLNHHWMFMTGLGFNSLGFEYALSENYSLLRRGKDQGQFTKIISQFGAVEIPAMVFYKLNPNCKNARWLVGAGFALGLVGAQTINNNAAKANDGSSSVNYISSSSTSNGGNYGFLRWSVAREKMYKKGGILNLSLLLNMGFHTIAQSTVNYTIDNQSYTHSFSNNGSFAALRLAYFFRPFHKSFEKAKKAAVTK